SLHSLDELTFEEENHLYDVQMALYNATSNMGSADHPSGITGPTEGGFQTVPHTRPRATGGASELNVNTADYLEGMTLDSASYEDVSGTAMYTPQVTSGPPQTPYAHLTNPDHPENNPMNVGYGGSLSYMGLGMASFPPPRTPAYQPYSSSPLGTRHSTGFNPLATPTPTPISSRPFRTSWMMSLLAHHEKSTSSSVAMRTVNSQHLQHSGDMSSTITTSGGTSGETASVNNTLFSSYAPSHGNSFGESMDVAADAPSHKGPSDANTSCDTVAPADPLPEAHQPNVAAGSGQLPEEPRYWEQDWVINFWAGKNAPPERLDVAMALGPSPLNVDQLQHAEWQKLLTMEFSSSRSVTWLADIWQKMVEKYLDICAYGASQDGNNNTAVGIAMCAMN
ncbi:hypothetical protein FRC08_018643, partial [Ceratobasidium sp. 394]